MTSRGNLRHITEEDLELIRSWRNHPRVASKMYTQHEISADEHKTWWARTSVRVDQEYFIYERAEDLLGVVGFTQIDLTNSNCFWAFYTSPTAPRGTGSCMELLALEHVFSTLGLQKLSCEVLSFNEPVIRLHKKFGFQVEGVFREHHKLDNQYIDIVRLGLLARDWVVAREVIPSVL